MDLKIGYFHLEEGGRPSSAYSSSSSVTSADLIIIDRLSLPRLSVDSELRRVDNILGKLQKKVTKSKDFDQRLRLQLARPPPDNGLFPIQVNNSSLLTYESEGSTGGELRDDLELNRDYYLVPESLWSEILSWNVFSIDCDIATILSHQ